MNNLVRTFYRSYLERQLAKARNKINEINDQILFKNDRNYTCWALYSIKTGLITDAIIIKNKLENLIQNAD